MSLYGRLETFRYCSALGNCENGVTFLSGYQLETTICRAQFRRGSKDIGPCHNGLYQLSFHAHGGLDLIIEEGRAASKSPHKKFGYFLSISQQEISANNRYHSVRLLVVSLVSIMTHPPRPTPRVYSLSWYFGRKVQLVPANRQQNLVWFGEIERKLAKLSMTTFAYRSSS